VDNNKVIRQNEDDLALLKLNNGQIEDYENLNEYKNIAHVAKIQSIK
jgi:hypothetical protein